MRSSGLGQRIIFRDFDRGTAEFRQKRSSAGLYLTNQSTHIYFVIIGPANGTICQCQRQPFSPKPDTTPPHPHPVRKAINLDAASKCFIFPDSLGHHRSTHHHLRRLQHKFQYCKDNSSMFQQRYKRMCSTKTQTGTKCCGNIAGYLRHNNLVHNYGKPRHCHI